MTFLEEKIRMSCETLQNYIVTDSEKITDITYIRCPYKTSNTPPGADEGWEVYDGGALYFEKDELAYF